MRRILNLLFLFIIAPVFLQGQDYLWPTDASNHLTSSFCEYRSGHYHSAIDIKTWGREGYPCYAVEDGEVYRVRVSLFGYGKVVYLKLKDGNYAIYAHLQRFNDQLAGAVRERQLAAKKYSLNWYPQNWRVKKGDLIGYTGQTGIGVPHLHFEIRNPESEPINPLQFYDDRVTDNIAPRLRELLVIPRNPDSKVDHSFEPQVFSLQKTDGNTYRITRPIKVKGLIGLALRGYDMANGVTNKFAFYNVSLFVDDRLHFQMQYDKMNFRTTNQIDQAIYYPLRAERRGVFNKLFIDRDVTLPFYNRKLGPGTIKVDRPEIPFRIEASDFFGNVSRIEGKLIRDGIQPAQIEVLNKIKDLVYLQVRVPKILKELSFACRAEGADWQTVEYFEILRRKYEDQQQTLLVKVRLNDAAARSININLVSENNEAVSSQAALNPENNTDIQFDIIHLGKHLLCRFRQVEALPGLRLKMISGDDTLYHTPEIFNNYFEQVLSAADFRKGSLQMILQDQQQVFFDSTLTYRALFPDQKQSFAYFDDVFILKSENAGPFDTLLVSARSLTRDENSGDYPVFSSPYMLKPANQKFNESVSIRLRYDSLHTNPAQMGLYSYNGNGKISFISNDLDMKNGYISARVKSFGTYLIAADTVAPRLNVRYPRNNQVLDRLNKIDFYMEDDLSGIGSEENIRISLDGRFVLPEWDPERDHVIGRPHWQLTPGRHELVISVKDAAGNVSEEKRNFILR